MNAEADQEEEKVDPEEEAEPEVDLEEIIDDNQHSDERKQIRNELMEFA